MKTAGDTLLLDLRYAARMLGKHPGFTTVAVVSLGLGIGATTAAFGVLNAAVLRPLAAAEPDRPPRSPRVCPPGARPAAIP
jgi:putative ABC transport system permease protein